MTELCDQLIAKTIFMISYNVTIKVEQEAASNWVKWMTEEHMPELRNTGLFFGYRLCRMLDQDEQDGITFSAQYYCNQMEDYNSYIELYADKMRAKAFEKFGGRFVAFRSVMEVIAEQ